MKTSYIGFVMFCALLVFTTVVSAQYYGQRTETITVQPKYPDLVPNDGLMDAGTWANPMTVQSDRRGAPSYEVGPKYPDLVPNDGLMDAGTWANPNQIKVTY